jgi:Tol biopolymer transport system component
MRALALALLALLALLPAGGASAGASSGWIAAMFDPGGGPIWRVDPANGAKRIIDRGKAEDLAWSRDGSRLVFHEWTGPDRSRVSLRFLGAAGRRAGYAVPNASSASFSPDGRRVISQMCLAWCLGTASLRGKDVRFLLRCVRCLLYEPAWSPRGGRYAYVLQRDYADRGTTMTIMVRTFAGRVRPLIGEGRACERQGAPEWSPDATQIAFVCDQEWIVVARADGRSFRAVAKGSTFAWSPDGRRLVVSREENLRGVVSIVEVATRKTRTVLRGKHAYSLAWRPVR